MKYAKVDADGRIIAVTTGYEQGWTAVPSDVSPFTHHFSGGVLTAYTADEADRLQAKPRGYPSTWDAATKTWVDQRPLADIKRDRWEKVRAQARAAALGGFTAAGFNWESDLEAQQALTVTIQDMAPGETTTWYTADGEAKTLTFAQIKALGRALRNHLAAQRDRAATLRAQIAAATTPEQVSAIQW